MYTMAKTLMVSNSVYEELKKIKKMKIKASVMSLLSLSQKRMEKRGAIYGSTLEFLKVIRSTMK